MAISTESKLPKCPTAINSSLWTTIQLDSRVWAREESGLILWAISKASKLTMEYSTLEQITRHISSWDTSGFPENQPSPQKPKQINHSRQNNYSKQNNHSKQSKPQNDTILDHLSSIPPIYLSNHTIIINQHYRRSHNQTQLLPDAVSAFPHRRHTLLE